MQAATSAFEPGRPWRRIGWWVLAVLSVPLCLGIVGAHPSRLFDQEGWRNASDILGGLRHPDVSSEFLWRVFDLSIESVLIGLLGTTLAAAMGTGMAWLATRVPDWPDPPQRLPGPVRHAASVMRWSVRWVMGLLRAVPEIVWAYVLVHILGLGPGPAVLAIALTSGGSIGKLCSELAEAVDLRPVLAMRATGASRTAIMLWAVLPQVRRQWIAYVLYRLECNIRNGTILGVVGAGGLGSEIALSIRYFQYDKLATTLLAVLSFVVLLELLSQQLRQRRTRWTLGLAAVGTGVAWHRLDIPWADLASPSALSLFSFEGGWPTLDALSHVLGLTADTLMMAWAATGLSALVAVALAPLIAAPLTTGSYLTDAPGRRGLTAGWRYLSRGVCTVLMQVSRAMPEMTLALVFVVWVGGGPLAGILAIAVHNAGVLGRLFGDVMEEVEPGPPSVLQAQGAGGLATFVFGVWPQIRARLAAFTSYRFECNVRATVMVGFVGAGGLGDALNNAISLFHARDLTVLLLTMVTVVSVVDALGDRWRARLLRGQPHRDSSLVFIPST